MKRRYKVKETNKINLKSYLKSKSNTNTNERSPRHNTSRNS